MLSMASVQLRGQRCAGVGMDWLKDALQTIQSARRLREEIHRLQESATLTVRASADLDEKLSERRSKVLAIFEGGASQKPRDTQETQSTE